MSDTPPIPYGYKRIQGQLQKGDGVWNGTRFARVKKVLTPVTVMKMRWPVAGDDAIAIRKCEVEQTIIPETQPPQYDFD